MAMKGSKGPIKNSPVTDMKWRTGIGRQGGSAPMGILKDSPVKSHKWKTSIGRKN